MKKYFQPTNAVDTLPLSHMKLLPLSVMCVRYCTLPVFWMAAREERKTKKVTRRKNLHRREMSMQSKLLLFFFSLWWRSVIEILIKTCLFVFMVFEEKLNEIHIHLLYFTRLKWPSNSSRRIMEAEQAQYHWIENGDILSLARPHFVCPCQYQWEAPAGYIQTQCRSIWQQWRHHSGDIVGSRQSGFARRHIQSRCISLSHNVTG